MTNFTLKFGKFKGMNFNATPVWYQEWLVKQDWFKSPIANKLTPIHREMSELQKSLNGWDGNSRKGQYAYDRIFELEQQESEIVYCNCGRLNEIGKNNCGWDCGY